jgi:anthrone oxygenase-like protein
MAVIAGLLATLAAGLFTGAAVYITFVEHPARVSCGLALAVTEFGPSYKRATVMQASLALVGAGAGITRWLTGGGLGWLVSGVLLGAVVPFTLILILPTNHRLLDASLDKVSPEAEALLDRWGRLHAVRSALSVVAFVSFLVLLAKG